MMKKNYIYPILMLCFFSLMPLLLNNNTLQAQEESDPCIEAGYVFSIETTDVTCPGGANGTASIGSTGCACVSSGCLFQWSNDDIFHTAANLPAGEYSVTVTHPNGCIFDTTMMIHEPNSFIDYVAIEHESCMVSGALEVIPSSVAGPLSFAWSTGDSLQRIENLVPGEYEVTVTNFMGCSVIETLFVEAAEMFDLATTANPSCGGSTGSAAVEVLGGVPPYNYLWNDPSNCIEAQAENLGAGTYEVTVTDANGCEQVSSVEVGENIVEPAYSLDITPACGDDNLGSITATVVGENSPYSLTWSNGATGPNNDNLEAGLYTVYITDTNGCMFEINDIEVTTSDLAPSLSASQLEVCSGDVVQLSATGGSSYTWSDGIEVSEISPAMASVMVTESSTYEVNISNGSCNETLSVTITTLPAPELTVSATEEVICAGESIMLIASVPSGAIFSWWPTENVSNPNINATIATPSETTTYIVTATNTQGCAVSKEVTVIVEDCSAVGINEQGAIGLLRLYPNPSKGFFMMDIPNHMQVNDVQVYSTKGQLVYSSSNILNGIDLSNATKGVYYVVLNTNTMTYRNKLIIY